MGKQMGGGGWSGVRRKNWVFDPVINKDIEKPIQI